MMKYNYQKILMIIVYGYFFLKKIKRTNLDFSQLENVLIN